MKKTTTILLSVLLIAGAFSFTGCHQTNNNLKNLRAYEWVLENITDHERQAVISGPDEVYIVFSDSSRVHGNAGCNTFNGMYETEAYDQIGLSRLATTQMWCFNMDFETEFLDRLEKVVSYQADDDRLELTGTGNSFTMVFRPRSGHLSYNR